MKNQVESESADCNQLQKEELSVLESIYLSDLEIIKGQPPLKLNIKCKLFLDTNYIIDDTDLDFVEYCQNLTYNVEIEMTKKYPYDKLIFEVENYNKMDLQLLEIINNEGNALLDQCQGQPAVFTLVEKIRDLMQENIYLKKRRDQKITLINVSEKTQLNFTPVTVENFVVWKAKFMAEQAELKKKNSVSISSDNTKLTGRQMFEKNSVLVISDTFEDAEDYEDDSYYEETKQE